MKQIELNNNHIGPAECILSDTYMRQQMTIGQTFNAASNPIPAMNTIHTTPPDTVNVAKLTNTDHDKCNFPLTGQRLIAASILN